MRSEELIGRLAADLRPVRPMPPPALQALQWLLLALLVIGCAVAVYGLRHDIHDRMAIMWDVGQFLASVATGIAAAFAAALLARPDRPGAWALLPVGPLLLWLAALGWGTFADVHRIGPEAMAMDTSWGCLKFILGTGTPLTVALLLLLRHAGPVRPLPVLLLGGLASASLASAGLSLFHHLDAMLMVLIWHGSAVAVLVVLAWALGARLLLQVPRQG
ncbi:NrsF family protein [Paracraurococcus ruber]|uniref:DUF1109 domain-containing protein n=1 Tax=Paracraurococcus ruber TaxID=77675 RepID=A0ABS1CX91_9PROT|nr:NrsF family protein [Paracraurococcus ruber]MBK1658940.1 hypothetical protein [Paracraurococcus ruber]TDG32302.1 DUF1109 domain-containing protein [Paracraurococcus ruber]